MGSVEKGFDLIKEDPPEIHHEPETVPDLLIGAPLITQADIDARVVKAFTGVGLTAKTARMVMESMRQEGIVYTILSL